MKTHIRVLGRVSNRNDILDSVRLQEERIGERLVGMTS